ncbi:hypothetical protein ACOSQ2_015420 [Xanthoceras sorbifolium]|uniref:Uncharacterized protein n=1 Tax=Xanthoceras sorbifolium TaxID=99658 RepID=A0ABQ8I6Q9_9ROSI|nr:hypothetical protein JRO89_XS04G0211000 [Xanthoceras sorbifolium]
MEPPKPEDPPLTSKESFIKRYKPVWRFFLVFNLGLAGYIFAKEKMKKMSSEDDKFAKPTVEDSKATEEMEPLVPPTVVEPVKVREPIPEEQQRELFQWILEEKRKLKPKDTEEKKRIDEEKAILKQFIRAKSIPQL